MNNLMEQKILDILRKLFESDSIDTSCSPIDTSCSQTTCSKWDSMNHLNLILDLEDAFGVSFEPEEIWEIKSYDDIVRLLTKKGIPSA